MVLDEPRLLLCRCFNNLAGVLGRILEVQKMDVHDIEGIHPLLAALVQRHAPADLSEDTSECSHGAPCASSEGAAPVHGMPAAPTTVHGYGDKAAASANASSSHNEHHPTKRREAGNTTSMKASDDSAQTVTTANLSSQQVVIPVGSVSNNMGAQLMHSQQRCASASIQLEDARSGTAPSIGTGTELANEAGRKAPAGNASAERDEALERLLSANFETAADAIRGYLVAATAKDCSLMITLAPCLPRPAQSGDTSHGGSAIAASSRAAAELSSSEVDCCPETINRGVSSSAPRGPQPLGDLRGCEIGQGPMTGSKEVASGIAHAAAKQSCVGQEGASFNERAVGGITGTTAAGECCLSSHQMDPNVGSVVQNGQTGIWWRYKVAIVDLDMKPLSKVEQHFRLDQQILECVFKTDTAAAPGTE